MKKILKKFETLKLNRIIWLLTLSDISSWGMYTAVSGLVGLYLSSILQKDAVEIVGIGVGIYYLSRCITQVPVGYVVDRIEGSKDDIIALILGCILMGIPFLLYPYIQHELAYYILQAIMGFGVALNLVNWRKLFATNLDKGKEGFTYGLYDTIFSAAIAVFSFVVGSVASISQAHFNFVMTAVGLFIVVGSIFPVLIFLTGKKQLDFSKLP
jgi:MFS family permease